MWYSLTVDPKEGYTHVLRAPCSATMSQHLEDSSPRTVKDKSRCACSWKLVTQMSGPCVPCPGDKLKRRPG